MAVKAASKSVTPVSTGEHVTRSEPVVTVQTVDNTSTGAVEYPEPAEVRVAHYDDPVEVRVATPTEPVTVNVTWIQDLEAQSKTIDAPEKDGVVTSDVKVETK